MVCVIDFHVDLAGCSVYYYVVQGSKMFLLLEPTKHNISKYENLFCKAKTKSCDNQFLIFWFMDVNNCRLNH